MTIRLTAEQSALWDEGFWSARRLEDDIIEQLDRDNITEQVVVTLDTGEVIFAVYRGRLL
jgi:hypothetical protein